MNEWEEHPLGRLVSFQKGRKVDTSDFIQDSYLPYLGASGIEGRPDGYGDKRFGILSHPSDTLMLWDGERSGLVGFGKHGVVASTVTRLTPNDQIEPKYLYFSLRAKFDWIQHRRTGTGVPHVPKDLGRLLRIHFPKDRVAQQQIVTILTSIDTAIEKTEALIAKYQQIKAGLMHDLFTRGVLPYGQLRPPREQAPELYQETSIGWIPKDWKIESVETALESVADGPFGSNLKTEHYVIDAGVEVVRLQNIAAYEYEEGDKAYISSLHAKFLVRNKVVAGDVLIAGLGDERYAVGRACCYPPATPPAINKADCFRARCNPAVMENRFFMLFLNSELARHQMRRFEQGVTRPRINTGNLKRVIACIPDLDEQRLFITKFEAIQKVLHTQAADAMALRNKKLGLMQDLLTGKVPVKVDAPVTEVTA